MTESVKGWLVAFGVMVALFALPIGLVGYPVLSGHLDSLDWMIYAGLVLCAPATLGYLWFCIGREVPR